MSRRPRRRPVLLALVITAVLVGTDAGCAVTGGSSGGGLAGKYFVWDPYPQFDQKSAWAGLLNACGKEAGVTVIRNSYDTGEMATMVEVAAPQQAQPDVLIVDNPTVSTLAHMKLLTTTAQSRLDTSAVEPNLLAAGRLDGSTYGVPIGANTLALYYNKAVLKAAGVDVSSITDWASLTSALRRVTATGRKGITFAAVDTEEGTFQFLPWFWGAGAQLGNTRSAQAVAALTLLTDWVRKGYTVPTVLTNTQDTSWKDFQSGNVAFAENGTWQLAPAGKLPFDYGIVRVPARNGGSAAVPLGGEFVTVPVQQDASRYAVSSRIVTCLTSAQNSLATDRTLSYIAPTAAVQRKQVAADPSLAVWVSAVQSAKGRTSDNLGPAYPAISSGLANAVHDSLSGSKSPQAALAAAKPAAK
ncbi:extracellular solute-binding protein [Streptacidiphilus sp. N1-3]|uniref:Extracellular solute-binding protein n=1 Tax=Streptacidiphilus alkalitolerans TaxID=3342712 RepID=A0ABV6XE18_9ACTN